MKWNVSVICFKFRCNILISGKIIKEIPGSVASGTPCIISLLNSSTCLEHYVLFVRRLNFYYTASGIITFCRWPSGAQVERRRPPTGVMIPDAVLYNFDLLMMSTQCSKHVEEYNKLIIKQDFVHQVG